MSRLLCTPAVQEAEQGMHACISCPALTFLNPLLSSPLTAPRVLWTCVRCDLLTLSRINRTFNASQETAVLEL